MRVARACHELRGPLGAARLALAALDGEAPPARLAALDLELRRAGLALEDLGGRPRRPPRAAEEPIAVAELLREQLAVWDLVARALGASLVVGAELPGVHVLGDRRAARAGASATSSSTRSSTAAGASSCRRGWPGMRVRIEVSDEGPGLPAGIVALAERREGATRHGHGLAIAASVARRHGGRLAPAPSRARRADRARAARRSGSRGDPASPGAAARRARAAARRPRGIRRRVARGGAARAASARASASWSPGRSSRPGARSGASRCPCARCPRATRRAAPSPTPARSSACGCPRTSPPAQELLPALVGTPGGARPPARRSQGRARRRGRGRRRRRRSSPAARVDVLVTRDERPGAPGRTVLALEDVEVLAVASAPAGRPTGRRRVAASLRVTLRQAVYLAAAQAFARELRLLPRAPGDRARGRAGLTADASLERRVTGRVSSGRGTSSNAPGRQPMTGTAMILKTARTLALALLAFAVALPAAANAATARTSSVPTVSNVAPLKVAIGDQLTITGSNFRAGKGKNTVVFKRDGQRAVFVTAEQATATQIRLTVPAKLSQYLSRKNGGTARPTRFRLRVLSARFGRAYTATKLSPVDQRARRRRRRSPTRRAPTVTDAAGAQVTTPVSAAPDCDGDGQLNAVDARRRQRPPHRHPRGVAEAQHLQRRHRRRRHGRRLGVPVGDRPQQRGLQRARVPDAVHARPRPTRARSPTRTRSTARDGDVDFDGDWLPAARSTPPGPSTPGTT